LISNLRQIRPTVDLLSPARSAIEARGQCVVSDGISFSVAASGATLVEIRDVLRHRDIETTIAYKEGKGEESGA
jgi:hypothetical protein